MTSKESDQNNVNELPYHNFQSLIELKKYLSTQPNVFEKAALTPEIEKCIDDFFQKRISNKYKPARKYYEISLLPEMCKVMTKKEWENMMQFISQQFSKCKHFFEEKSNKNFDELEQKLKQNVAELQNTTSNKETKCKTTLESCEFIIDSLLEAGITESDVLDFIYLCLQKYLDFFNLSILQHKEIAKYFDFVPRTLRYFKTMKYKSLA